MTSTNILIASFYSFLIHAGLFLGFFGYFEQTAKPNKILSSPLSVKMLVEEQTPNTQKKTGETDKSKNCTKNIIVFVSVQHILIRLIITLVSHILYCIDIVSRMEARNATEGIRISVHYIHSSVCFKRSLGSSYLHFVDFCVV